MNAILEFFEWLMNGIGFAVCHQLGTRSFAYGGRVLPVCARDTGLFLGFALAFCAMLVVYRADGNRYPRWPVIVVLCVMVVPMVIDGATSYAGVRETGNLARIATGSLAGAAAAALVFPLASRSMFPGGGDRRIMEKWWSAPLLLLIPAFLTLVVPLGWKGGYWLWSPLVSLSILGTLLVLNFIVLSLAIEWARPEAAAPSRVLLASCALVLAALEIVASNRLHWLLNRI